MVPGEDLRYCCSYEHPVKSAGALMPDCLRQATSSETYACGRSVTSQSLYDS